MSNYKATSWGRTRGPKNIAGPHGTEAVTSTGNPSAATDGYSTENQKYLHMLLDTSTSGENRTVTVYAYSHAFGRWWILDNGSGSNLTIAANNTTAVRAGTDAVEIKGVDRLFFKVNDTLADNDEFFAACSTLE